MKKQVKGLRSGKGQFLNYVFYILLTFIVKYDAFVVQLSRLFVDDALSTCNILARARGIVLAK